MGAFFMKKTVFLPVFAFAVFISHAHASYCFWAADNCWEINSSGDVNTDAQCIAKSGRVVEDCANPGFTLIKCFYKPGECYDKTEEECEDTSGRIVEDCDNPGFTLQYCDYGKYVSPTSGGCYLTTDPEQCEKTQGRVVEECPATSLPPSSSSSGGSISSSSSAGSTNSSSSSVTYYDYCILPNGTCLKVSNTPDMCVDTKSGEKGTSTNTDCRSSSSATTSSSSTTTGNSSSSAGAGGSSSSAGASTTYDFCMIGSLCAEGPYTYEECRDLDGIPLNNCTTPIITLPKPAHSNGLIAMQNAVNLQVTGSAAVQIFDLKGNAIRSMKFAQGNYIVPLSDLPRGLYIVKASNASWKQTIKVTVR
jgi:hypothetical protein